MHQFEIGSVKCRLDQMSADGTSGTSSHEFCLYEFPRCAACPHAVREKPVSRSVQDPMESEVLRGWIRGLPHIST